MEEILHSISELREQATQQSNYVNKKLSDICREISQIKTQVRSIQETRPINGPQDDRVPLDHQNQFSINHENNEAASNSNQLNLVLCNNKTVDCVKDNGPVEMTSYQSSSFSIPQQQPNQIMSCQTLGDIDATKETSSGRQISEKDGCTSRYDHMWHNIRILNYAIRILSRRVLCCRRLRGSVFSWLFICFSFC